MGSFEQMVAEVVKRAVDEGIAEMRAQLRLIQGGRQEIRTYNTNELSLRLGVPAITLRAWCASGLFPGAFKPPASGRTKAKGTNSRLWLVPHEAVIAFIRAGGVPVQQQKTAGISQEELVQRAEKLVQGG